MRIAGCEAKKDEGRICAVLDVVGKYLGGRVGVSVGDITKMSVDAIVNAANSSLLGGGGVDGAIHRAGGSSILAACREIRKRFPSGLPTGEAVITTGGRLSARYVIHTVGPIWGEARSAELLARCYRRSLEVAVEHDCRTLAFPAISTGVYGYPREEAARVSSGAIAAALAESPVERVELVFFNRDDADVFLAHQTFDLC